MEMAVYGQHEHCLNTWALTGVGIMFSTLMPTYTSRSRLDGQDGEEVRS